MPSLLRPDRAEVAARVITAIAGDTATLREDQQTAVAALCEPAARVLVVQATGWGKSAVYWAATAIRRSEGAGPALVVSPLLSLMRDQVAAAERAGLRAATLNSSNIDAWSQIEADLAAGAVDVLLVSPERLANPGFGRRVLDRLAGSIGLLVIDEAHAVSDWGHDFRPDYRRVSDVLQRLNPQTPVLATTATANQRVTDDVATQLGDSTLVLRGPLARDSLQLTVVDALSPIDRYAWVVDQLPDLPGSGIVYALTVADAERLAETIRARHGSALPVAAYTGGLEPAERERLEDGLRRNRLKALIATSALGMGYDKPDLGFVVHVGSPPSPVSYYQQVGRAGRGIDHAHGRAAALRRRRRHLGLLRHGHHPRPRPDATAADRARGLQRRHAGHRAPAGGRDRPAAGTGGADAQAAGRRRRGRAGRAGMGARRVGVDLRPRALRRDHRHPATRGRHHARLHPWSALPHAAAAGVARRRQRGAVRPVLGLSRPTARDPARAAVRRDRGGGDRRSCVARRTCWSRARCGPAAPSASGAGSRRT